LITIYLDLNSYNHNYSHHKFITHKPETCPLVRYQFTSYFIVRSLAVSLLLTVFLSTLDWLSYSSDSSSPTELANTYSNSWVCFVAAQRLLLWEYVSIQPLTSNGRWWLRNASNNRLPRKWRFSTQGVQLSQSLSVFIATDTTLQHKSFLSFSPFSHFLVMLFLKFLFLLRMFLTLLYLFPPISLSTFLPFLSYSLFSLLFLFFLRFRSCFFYLSLYLQPS
jgi:hypothetical protein